MSAVQEIPQRIAVTDRNRRFHIGPVGIFVVALVFFGVGLAVEFLNHQRASLISDLPPAEIPPWGELLEVNVNLEQPEEYLAFELAKSSASVWAFDMGSAEQVRAILLECGFTTTQADVALSHTEPSETGLKVFPSDDLLLSLTSEVRGKLYGRLSANAANHYMAQPYRILEGGLDEKFRDSGVDRGTVDLVRKLLYPRGKNLCFSDVELVLRRAPDEKTKIALLKALTRQPAVLTRVRIRPETDIDKLLGYWASGSGARAKDVRPLIESLKRLEHGGTISLMYFLPPFARERLYTTPLPTKPGEKGEDCHWSALNFFNATPDDRFSDTAFTSRYIDENCYQIAKPAMLGDLVFLLDEKGGVIHSAVYVADDLVFTKNGINYAQPWILMRMKDLLALYSSLDEPKTLFYRRNIL
jgi:hypothetical protein